MRKSLVKNCFYYFFYSISNMLFPFITSLYVARILLPENIGEVAYAQNIVNYFAILAFLGLPTYGLREIAVVRNNNDELSRVYSELFTINLISTIFFSILYYGLILLNKSFHYNLLLYNIIGLTVILNMFNISWLYEGLEEFGYVSLRNAAFKIVMLALIVSFVRNEDDIIPYAVITVFGTAGNGIINVVYSRKFVRYSPRGLNMKRHLKPVFMLVMVNLAIEIYSMVDITMLGYMLSKDHVAFYSYAIRVNRMILQLTNTFTVVLVPRISLHYKEGNIDEFNRLLTRGLEIIVLFALPMIIGMQFTARFLFPALFGSEYIASASVEQILCLLILISPIGYLLGSRVMLVSNNEMKMMICVSIGAVINVILNYMLIPVLYENGAAIASVISEIVIAIIYVNYGRKIFKLYSVRDSFLKIGFALVLITLCLLTLDSLLDASWFKIIIEIFVAVLVYITSLFVVKEETTISCLKLYNYF